MRSLLFFVNLTNPSFILSKICVNIQDMDEESGYYANFNSFEYKSGLDPI